MVIGTAAYCGSGQDTLADGICSIYGLRKFGMGDMVRKLAEDQGKPKNRSALREIRQECDRLYGRKFFPQMLIDTINGCRITDCVITGLRTMEEYSLFKEAFDFYFIFVDAPEDIRLERMLQRKEEKDEDTISALKRQMDAECALFDYEDLETVADINFDFSMGMDEYKAHKKLVVSQVMEELGVWPSEDNSMGV